MNTASPRLLLACFVAAFIVFALFTAWVLGDHGYEVLYLGLGSQALRGELTLYQDELPGHWVPAPFYVYGLTQLIVGPSLVAARALGIALGLLVLVLTFVIAARWGGPAAAAVACGLFCTNGFVIAYFATAHFAPLVAALHLAGLYVLFCTDWTRRDLLAMAIFSLLFLVKPHYWPTIPFVLVFLLWRASTVRVRLALVAIALVAPAAFLISDVRHLKILASVPVLHEWVEPLGFRSMLALHDDPAELWTSDYVRIPWGTTLSGRLSGVVLSLGFLAKRYVVWLAALAVVGGLAMTAPARRAPAAPNARIGLRFTCALFFYLIAWQFLAVGPYTKQAFAYVGAVAPLLAIVVGCCFTAVWTSDLARPLRLAAVVVVVLSLVVSPWIHRSHALPRNVSMEAGGVPSLNQLARTLRELIPPGEQKGFLLGDPLPLHLAGRSTYVRQAHHPYMAFTTLRDRERYARIGMWGIAEIEQWLGGDSRWAVIQESVLDFYRHRPPYARAIARMNELLTAEFRLVRSVPGHNGEVFHVYRRKE